MNRTWAYGSVGFGNCGVQVVHRPISLSGFCWLIGRLGYEPKKAGKTGGSRRKFYNPTSGHLIMLDEPHDGEMRRGMVKRLQQELQDRGVI